MKATLKAFYAALRKRVVNTFGDKNAWFLAIPAGALLLFLDVAKLLTLLEWMLYAAVIAGFAIQISRTVFPQVDLTEMVKKAREESRSAGAVASALIVFVGLLILSIALWTKP